MKTNEAIIKELIKTKVKTLEDLAKAKRWAAKKYKASCPSNIILLKTYHELVKNKKVKKSSIIETLLRTRPIRSLSGIVNISVLTKPYPCPGKCIYCPLESGIPKSYLSGEPAVERAKKLNYNPYLQVKKRVEMLEATGHPTDKIELRIVGGTWSYYPKDYQNQFIKKCFDACNDKNLKLKSQKSKLRIKSKNLKGAQEKNEKAKHRIIGLSVETRPDFINPAEIKRLRNFGVTMVELGVQSIYDDVLRLNLRGHGVKETIVATKLLKDAGFKILYQMMPNLLGSNLKRDEKMFEELFSNPDFQPDLLKIYPCALVKEASLYKWWKQGKYKPYTQSQLISLMKSVKKKIPYYVRIQRISRDIPSPAIVTGGAKVSNLRQILLGKMKREGWQCRCIRCREVKGQYNKKEKIYLFRQDYRASDGEEIFLSFENPAPETSSRYGASKNRKLYSLLRLRITSRREAIIRELHTYGQLQPINRERVSVISPQHKGLGKKLMKEAEKVTKREFGLNKIAVISGIGARNYYRKLGYKLKNTYMVKIL